MPAFSPDEPVSDKFRYQPGYHRPRTQDYLRKFIVGNRNRQKNATRITSAEANGEVLIVD